MNLSSFKAYLMFCESKVKEVKRFEMVTMWIMNQSFYKTGNIYSFRSVLSTSKINNHDYADAAELLDLIKYELMTYQEFLSGPGNSSLIDFQSKYIALCTVKSQTRCYYCGRCQNSY